MIIPPNREDTLMVAKELADATGIPLSVIYAARSGGFPMPGRQATPNELRAWLAAHPAGARHEDAASAVDYYDALRYPAQLIAAARVARSFFYSARRCGFRLDADGRSTVRAFRAWLVAHPDFRAEHGYNRRIRKGRTVEKCGDKHRLPSDCRLKANPPPIRPHWSVLRGRTLAEASAATGKQGGAR